MQSCQNLLPITLQLHFSCLLECKSKNIMFISNMFSMLVYLIKYRHIWVRNSSAGLKLSYIKLYSTGSFSFCNLNVCDRAKSEKSLFVWRGLNVRTHCSKNRQTLTSRFDTTDGIIWLLRWVKYIFLKVFSFCRGCKNAPLVIWH